MPRKAAMASSRGRGVRIALPGPTKKSGSSTPTGSPTQNQSESPTQTGSSTQKQTGSSTQVQSLVAESSTQQQTAKQTKADYAFPIQTLLALQDCGLTHLPTKTWAEIASEDENETLDLATLIKEMAKSKTIISGPSQKQIQTQTQSSKKPANPYIPKNKFSSVIQMEPEFWDKSPHKIPIKIFPEGFHFKPTALNKTRQFYEFILIDSDSVTIKHYKDKNDSSVITHSTIQILKVITPNQFGKNPNNLKKFSQNFDPIGYNYWDYIDAWSRVFWFQNKMNRHSWLIYFKRGVNYTFPNWFIQWWDFFGPIPQILPPPAEEGFKLFSKMYNSKESCIPADLKFFSVFSLAWIFSWQYRYGNRDHPERLPLLRRDSFVKWWTEFDASRANPDEVKSWFSANSSFLKPADPETSLFLNQKAKITAALAASQTKESFAKNLQNILNLLQEKDKSSLPSSSASAASSDDYYQNEDDCFGINLGDD